MELADKFKQCPQVVDQINGGHLALSGTVSYGGHIGNSVVFSHGPINYQEKLKEEYKEKKQLIAEWEEFLELLTYFKDYEKA